MSRTKNVIGFSTIFITTTFLQPGETAEVVGMKVGNTPPSAWSWLGRGRSNFENAAGSAHAHIDRS